MAFQNPELSPRLSFYDKLRVIFGETAAEYKKLYASKFNSDKLDQYTIKDFDLLSFGSDSSKSHIKTQASVLGANVVSLSMMDCVVAERYVPGSLGRHDFIRAFVYLFDDNEPFALESDLSIPNVGTGHLGDYIIYAGKEFAPRALHQAALPESDWVTGENINELPFHELSDDDCTGILKVIDEQSHDLSLDDDYSLNVNELDAL